MNAIFARQMNIIHFPISLLYLFSTMAEVEEQFETYEEQPVAAAEEPQEVEDVVYAPASELPEIKLFGRWSCDDVHVSDMSLAVRIYTSPHVSNANYLILIFFIQIHSGLHCCEREICSFHTTFSWSLCRQTFP